MTNQELSDALFEAREALRFIIANENSGANEKEKAREALYALYELAESED
jgi:hypothetical protein